MAGTQGVTAPGILLSNASQARTLLEIAKTDDGVLSGNLYRIDDGVGPIPITSIVLRDKAVEFKVNVMDVTYEGKLDADDASIAGIWTHGSTKHPLTLVRVTADSAWTIPPPSTQNREMPADADPDFEVATIKPSAPDRHGKNLDFEGRHFTIVRFNMNDLIAFAYGLHAKQIIGAPTWFETDFYDIDGIPDVKGDPTIKQMNAMIQKLLADRFNLVFHRDRKVLAVYAITVIEGGPKLTKSATSPDAEYDFSFPRRFGALRVRNLTMAEFASWIQADVLDRPVVDDTGLASRYDFDLNWTPDESQIAQHGGASSAMLPATDDPNAPPGLFTAIQEQLKLKLTPVKEPDDVIVISHVEKPSAN
jgi:uncharacterized protein (TIGR03435 family)